MSTRLKELYAMAYQQDLTSLEERLLNIAFNAVNLSELDHVIKNTQSVSIQDYALCKLGVFADKGMKRN